MRDSKRQQSLQGAQAATRRLWRTCLSFACNTLHHFQLQTKTQHTDGQDRKRVRREAPKPALLPPMSAVHEEESPSPAISVSSAPSPPAPPPQALPSVVAIEAEPEALLIGWEEVPGAVCYELQMSKKTPVATDG